MLVCIQILEMVDLVAVENKKELPILLTAKEIKSYLHIGNDKLYELLNRKDFPSFKIGNKNYVIQTKFIEWIEKQSKNLKYL